MIQILIIEDDKKLNDGIKLALKQEQYQFIQCQTIKDARQKLKGNKIDLILLDIQLPDGNGMDFLKEIRRKSKVSIIIITANHTETDIVMGLELGANDYITKPFSLMVLRARVEVQVRQHLAEKKTHFVIEEYDFDFEKMIFLVQGVKIELSKTEQRLLWLLVKNRGTTVTRSKLIDEVWSGDTEYVEEHALTVAIKRLRDKLGMNSSAATEGIKTVYGIGYTWELT